MKKIYCEGCGSELDGGTYGDIIERFQPTFCEECFKELFKREIEENIFDTLTEDAYCYFCGEKLKTLHGRFGGKLCCMPCFVENMARMRHVHFVRPKKFDHDTFNKIDEKDVPF